MSPVHSQPAPTLRIRRRHVSPTTAGLFPECPSVVGPRKAVSSPARVAGQRGSISDQAPADPPPPSPPHPATPTRAPRPRRPHAPVPPPPPPARLLPPPRLPPPPPPPHPPPPSAAPPRTPPL